LIIVNLFRLFDLVLLYMIFINSLTINFYFHLFFFFLLWLLLGEYQLLFRLFFINIEFCDKFIQSIFWSNLSLNYLRVFLFFMNWRTFLTLGVILNIFLIIFNRYIYNFRIILFLLLPLNRGSFLIDCILLLKILAWFHWALSLSFLELPLCVFYLSIHLQRLITIHIFLGLSLRTSTTFVLFLALFLISFAHRIRHFPNSWIDFRLKRVNLIIN
jgi:hypothetical protein